MKRFAFALCALAFLAPATSNAHDAWILPSATVLSGDEAIVTVDASVGNDKFYFNHRPFSLNNLTITGPNGKAVQAENKFSGKLRSGFDVVLSDDGTYRIAIASNGGIMARWKEGEQSKRWFGSAADFASKVPADAKDLTVLERSSRVETFATKGKPTTLAAVEAGLAMQPVTHPNDLFDGEEATFILTIDGKPAQGLDVEIVPEGSRYRDNLNEIKVTTNDKGEFKVTWPGAGKYWLHADTSDQNTSVPAASKRALSYSATLEVLPQ